MSAVRLVGMERQTLRDAVVCYNAAGLTGLYHRPKPGRRERLSKAEQASPTAHIFRGLDPDRDGVSTWTRADLCYWLEERFAKTFPHPACRGCSGGWSCHGRRPDRSISKLT
jgi:hypothetical protein